MKTCSQCQNEFALTPQDHAFFDQMKIPEPVLCPRCRFQRRSAHRNERSLYARTCDLCKKPAIFVFPPDSDYTAYCNDCWWSDQWDILDYARDFDFSRPFFEQFAELQKAVPHFALFQDRTSENCRYTNFGMSNKNCYLSVCAYCEDIYYSDEMVKSKSCVNCQKCVSCQYCYDCVDCAGSYNLFFSKDCASCHDSYFLEDCVACGNCFCCAGLRNKEFYFYNEKLSKEDYFKRLQTVEFTHESVAGYKKESAAVSLKVPKKNFHGKGNTGSTGDYLDNCKNVRDCFDCLGLEDSADCVFCGLPGHHLHSCTNTGAGSGWCYQTDGVVSANNNLCLFFSRNISDSQYCKYCYSSEFLFGCIGLRHKKYCVLNRQYTKEEYESLVPRIIGHMKSAGEYGDYFPISISPYGYNETKAQDYFPLTKEEALRKNYRWKDDLDIAPQANKTIAALKLPDRIEEIPEDILNWVILSEKSGRPFRLIPQELAFYRAHSIPVPHLHPDERHQNRLKLRNPRRLYDRKCQKCGMKIQTSYSPDRSEIVYCEACYLKEVY